MYYTITEVMAALQRSNLQNILIDNIENIIFC